MRLVFKNNEKELTQLMKAIIYTYDSYPGTKKQKKVLLYISSHYIAVINDFESFGGQLDERLCYFILGSQMYKIDYLPENFQSVIYKIDADLMMKLLSSNILSSLIQIEFIFPDLLSERKMEVLYQTEGGIISFSLSTQIETYLWKFQGGLLTTEIFSNHTKIVNFLQIPSSFLTDTNYMRRYVDVWFCLSPLNIKLKKIDCHFVVDEERLCSLEENYNYYELIEELKGNSFLCFRTEPFYRHLELANKEKSQCSLKLALVLGPEESVRRSYVIMQTLGGKKKIVQSFEILIRSELFSQKKGKVQQAPMNKSKKVNILSNQESRQEQFQPEVILNKFYGKHYEQQVSRRLAFKQAESLNSQKQQEQKKKYRIQF